jgi:hypothetical protein
MLHTGYLYNYLQLLIDRPTDQPTLFIFIGIGVGDEFLAPKRRGNP